MNSNTEEQRALEDCTFDVNKDGEVRVSKFSACIIRKLPCEALAHAAPSDWNAIASPTAPLPSVLSKQFPPHPFLSNKTSFADDHFRSLVDALAFLSALLL